MAKSKARDKTRQRNRTILEAPQFKKPQRQAKQPTVPKPTIPFDVFDDILLVGEGDFSFAASLVADHGATSILATTLDDEAACHAKHPGARENLASIAAAFASCPTSTAKQEEERQPQQQAQMVLYSVDATQLHKHPVLRRRRAPFRRVVFNFPHVGGRTTDVNRQARANQALLAGFFASAQRLLEPRAPPAGQDSERGGGGGGGNDAAGATNGGAGSSHGTDPLPQPTLLVTLFEGEPYSLWNVRDLARHAGLRVLRSFRFPAEAYPAYRHARTCGAVLDRQGRPSASAWKGEERAARMYEFGLKPAENQDGSSERTKKGHESSDED